MYRSTASPTSVREKKRAHFLLACAVAARGCAYAQGRRRSRRNRAGPKRILRFACRWGLRLSTMQLPVTAPQGGRPRFRLQAGGLGDGRFTVRGFFTERLPSPIVTFPPYAAGTQRGGHPGPGGVPLPRLPLPLRPPAVRPVDVFLSYDRAAKRAHAEPDARSKAIAFLAELANDYLGTSTLVQRIVSEEGPLDQNTPSLIAMVTAKSTATLLKRMCSLRLYKAWFLTTGAEAEAFFTEPSAYKYFKYLNDERAPATRAAAMRQALHFLGGLFAVDLAAIKASTRLHGLTVAALRTRGEVRQRCPLSVPMVIALEQLVLRDDGAGRFEALVAGAALFALYSRARIGDLSKCAIEPTLDVNEEKTVGYVETRFLNHKTARPGVRRALPITGNAFGLMNLPWADAWLRARAAVGLCAETQSTVLPAAASVGWHSVPLLTPEFAAQLRSVLLSLSFTYDQLANIGAHSLKVTCLAWAARYGMDRDQRRLLGYHLKAGDKSLECYSRDSMASPLRDLDSVLAEIRSGNFVPDVTRSGLFSGTTARPASSASTCSSPRSSSPSADSDSPEDTCEDLDGTVIILNLATKYHHITAGVETLRCNRPWPVTYERLSSVPPGGHLCSGCF